MENDYTNLNPKGVEHDVGQNFVTINLFKNSFLQPIKSRHS